MRKTAIVSILILCAGLFSASAQSAPAKDSETQLLTDSLGSLAPAPTQLTRSPVIVRKDLTESERQAPLDISISLKMRNFAELQQRIANGEFIPAEEMESRYYPTAADCKMVVNWLTEKGLQVQQQSKYNLSIFARGSIAQLETALGTRFARVQFDGNETSSALVPPTLPAAIAARVLGINGLQPHLRPRRHSKVMPASPRKLINNVPPYTVKEISNAYNASGLGVTGAGQKIGIVIDTFPSASDLVQFWRGNGIAQSLSNIEEVQVVQGTLPSPSGEETLDVEWTSGMAPGAKVRVYAATDLAFVHLDQAYQAILNDLPSQPQLHEVSLSYGLGELYMSTAQMQTDAQYFASLAASGVTIFVATGDGGSSPGEGGFADDSGPVQVESPANDPSVTAVGGTSLHLNSTTGAVTSESAWFYGGGGVSTFFARPSWQTGTGLPAGNFRTVPDVASVADLNTGGYLIFGGQLETVGGTSWGAPVWAGFCAMLNQARANFSEGPLGLLGPKIYISNGSSSFRDITSGSNGPRGVYNAGPFYDLCTGLGVANVSWLVQTLSAVPTSHPFTSSFLSYSGDFNGDGKQDILWRNTQTGDVDVWFMNSASIASQAHVGTAGLDWKIMGTADFNGDGKSDILWQNSTDGRFVIWIMQGSSHSDYEFSSPGSQWSIAGVADLDHSGFADILWRNTATGDLMGWKSSAGLNFTSFFIGTATLDWNLAGAADLFGNGQSALIWRNQNSGEVVAWQLNGGAIAAQSSLGTVSLNWTIAGFGNFNGDGHQDILWHSTSDGSVAAWYMNGFSVSPAWINQGSISQDWQIRATPDIFGAGLNSILWSNTNTGEQVIWIPGSAGFSQASIGFAPTPWAVQR